MIDMHKVAGRTAGGHHGGAPARAHQSSRVRALPLPLLKIEAQVVSYFGLRPQRQRCHPLRMGWGGVRECGGDIAGRERQKGQTGMTLSSENTRNKNFF